MPGTAPNDVLMGINAKLYYNTGTYGSPTWTEICIVGDVTLNMERSESSIAMRCSTWELVKYVLKKGSIDFKLWNIPGNTAFQAIRDAFNDATTIEVAVMDGDISTAATTLTQGLRAFVQVGKFNRSEPIEGAQNYDITLKPTYSSSAAQPVWYTVST